MALTHLPVSLKAALDQIDDALFEIANKADNSDRQNRYFDAMRELRMKRDDFEKDFFDTFSEEFANSLVEDHINASDKVDFASTLELSLVDTDEVEESLAVTNFVESVNSRCREELFGLDKRMAPAVSANRAWNRIKTPYALRLLESRSSMLVLSSALISK